MMLISKKILAVLLCAATLLSVTACGGEGNESSTIDPSSDTVSEDSSVPVDSSDESSEEPDSTPDEELAAKMNEAIAINDDVVGWLTVPNTNIDYPVLQDPNGKNNNFSNLNQYYIARDIYKKSSRNGVIYADDYNTFGATNNDLSRNTILYGHNWTNIEKNGAEVEMNNPDHVMFEQLPMLGVYEIAEKTPVIYFSTPDESMTWVIFAVFYTDIYKKSGGFYNYIDDAPTDKEFMAIVGEAKERSQFNYNVDLRLSDKILTLSTCTRRFGNNDDQRFVVMARLMRPGESIENFTAPTVNANPKRPSWYNGNR